MKALPVVSWLAAGLLCLPLPVLAQYKVVAPDGRVTYTDRPPADGSARVSSLGREGALPGTGSPLLPLELRQPASRYPVTLYTTADCPPCDAGRQYLQQRGIPFSERSVSNNDDSAALERLTGARTVPTLTVGSQALRGLSQNDWASYLDAAGYPRDSHLPPNWQQPPATPLVARAAPRPATPDSAAAPAPPPRAEVPAAPESKIRF
ncbi:MAG: glutaredoxin family protein [Burkholderiales bacterium]|nr:glutaredoxin family protein [Burkholderiales bacterium]